MPQEHTEELEDMKDGKKADIMQQTRKCDGKDGWNIDIAHEGKKNHIRTLYASTESVEV